MMNEKETVVKPYLNAEEATAALAERLPEDLQLTGRELMEIKHSMFYANECNHGTSGHNLFILVAKLARHIGFKLEPTDGIPVFDVRVPDGVEITKG